MTTIKTLLAFAVVTTLVMGACGSDDSGSSSSSDSFVSFSSSACKKENAGALTAQEAYAGLQCIRWKPSGADTLKVDLLNFDGGCGAQWKGSSKNVDGGVELDISNPGCLLAACGSCIYDWSFEVRATAGADLALSIVVDQCPGDQTPVTYAATLPLGATPEGELCRYADYGALGWQAQSLGTCGQAYMPCRQQNGMCDLGASSTPCEAGLTCGDGASATDQICLAPCSGDGDCEPAGTMTCQTGFCRPANTW